MQSVIRITGEINLELFQKSFDLVVYNYDCLRAGIVYKGLKNPKQVIYRYQKGPEIIYIDGSAEREKKEDILKGYLRRDKEAPFILERGSNIRLALIKYGEKEYVLALSFHHIILDGWSMGVFYTELFKNYEEMLFGKITEKKL